MEDHEWQQAAQALTPGMLQVAMGLLRHQADAEDAVQQALVNVWEKRRRIAPEKFRAYMMRTVINECRNIQRRRLRVTPMAEMPLTIAPENRGLTELMNAINALPDSLRLPLWLKYLEDFSEKEAAAALRIPVTTLRSRLHRARKILRKNFDWEVML